MINEVDAELLGLYMLLITYGEFVNTLHGRDNRFIEKHRRLPRGLLPKYSHVSQEKHPRQPGQSLAPRRDLVDFHYCDLC